MALAALISLKQTIINPANNLSIPISSLLELVSLCSTLNRLDDKRNRNIDRSAIGELEAQIREAAYRLEDTIQSHVSNRSISPSHGLANMRIHRYGLEKEIELFFERVKKLKEEYNRVLDNPLRVEEDDDDCGDSVPSNHDFGGNMSTTVGLSDEIEKIVHELLDVKPEPKSVSLLGMAGIGKSHIAREIYQHPRIVQHFRFRAWVSVGQKRQMKDILVDIVARIEGKPRNRYVGRSVYDLPLLLHKTMRDGRYLIVLDDVWTKDVSDYLRSWLPGAGIGRRIVLTTRLEEVAVYDCAATHKIRFLNNQESWTLLWQNVFGESYFPPQLEKVGRKIAEKCEGLPLLILTVARILRRLEKSEEFWKKVADKKTSVFTDAYDEILKVLYSSYEYLPQHLKACFLYMGVFPQSSEITLPKLINLWVVEDLVEAESFELDYTNPHIFAMKCLEKLVSNSLVIICKHSSNLRIKSSKIHSVCWHLCTKEARTNKLFHVCLNFNDGFKEDIEDQRRLSVQNSILFCIKEVYNSVADALTVRSLLFTGSYHEYPVPICSNLVLLKVLDAVAIRFYEFPVEVLKLVRLKYLGLTHHGKLPCSITNLEQLQYLILHHHHSIRFVRDLGSSHLPFPKEMRDEIRGMKEVWITKLLVDSTCLAEEIRDKICDIEEVWSSRVISNPTCLTKSIWMDILELNFGKYRYAYVDNSEELNTQDMMLHMEELWRNKLSRNSACLPKEIWDEIWKKIWDMQQVWSIKLQKNSISLMKEIWEDIWDIQEVRSPRLLSDSTFLPKEIWELRELRYLRIIGRNLTDPSYGTSLPKLNTLHVNAQCCTYNVFDGLYSLTKLVIEIEVRPDAAETFSCFKHIMRLKRLESLKCVVVNPGPMSQVVAPPYHLSNLPNCLLKLSLNGLGYGWECMRAIGSLPKLEVLKLRCSAFHGPEWETQLGEFPSLKFLLLEDLDVVRWTVVNDGCFPRLRNLIIGHCYKLKKIPGAIITLKEIEIVDCSPWVVASAQQYTASSVEVVITSTWKRRHQHAA